MKNQTKKSKTAVEINSKDLPLHCPLPNQTLWNAHPRVFLPIEKSGEIICPYCGTSYILVDNSFHTR